MPLSNWLDCAVDIVPAVPCRACLAARGVPGLACGGIHWLRDRCTFGFRDQAKARVQEVDV